MLTNTNGSTIDMPNEKYLKKIIGIMNEFNISNIGDMDSSLTKEYQAALEQLKQKVFALEKKIDLPTLLTVNKVGWEYAAINAATIGFKESDLSILLKVKCGFEPNFRIEIPKYDYILLGYVETGEEIYDPLRFARCLKA